MLRPVHIAPLPLAAMISTFGAIFCLSESARARLSRTPLFSPPRPRGKCPNTEIIAANPPLRWHVLAPDIFGAQPLDQ